MKPPPYNGQGSLSEVEITSFIRAFKYSLQLKAYPQFDVFLSSYFKLILRKDKLYTIFAEQ